MIEVDPEAMSRSREIALRHGTRASHSRPGNLFDGLRVAFAVLILLVAVWAGNRSAAAAPEDFLLLAKTQVDFQELRTAGVLTGCELDLLRTIRDPDKAQSGVVVIKTNLAFVAPNKDKIGWMLVINTADMRIVDGQMSAHPFVPVYDYLTTYTGFRSAGLDYFHGPCPDGGLCVFYQAEPRVFAGLLFNAPWLKISYERQVGGLDTEATMELPQQGAPEYERLTSLQRCVGVLAQIHKR